MGGDILAVLLTVLLLAANAFFVGAEFALISARRDRLEALAEQGKRRAVTVIRAGQNLSVMLAGAQLGITICSILLGRVGEPAVAHLLEKPFDLIGVPDTLLHTVSFLIAITIVVVLHVLLGEMVPKNIAIAGPESAAMLLVPPYLAWVRLARPVIAVYDWCAHMVLRSVGIKAKPELENTVSSVELSEMIAESLSEGLLDPEEHNRLSRALQIRNRVVGDVAIPLSEGHAVPAAGEGTGYGLRWTPNEARTIAIVPAGYADGLDTRLSGRASVLVRGIRVPIVGSVCMDMIMIDVTGLDVSPGDEVVLIGRQGGVEITAREIAASIGTIPWEVVCRLGSRIQRRYKLS